MKPAYKMNPVKFIQALTIAPYILLDIRIIFSLTEHDLNLLFAIIMTYQRNKTGVFTRHDLERYLNYGKFGRNNCAKISNVTLLRIAEKGYIQFVGLRQLGKNRSRSISAYSIVKPKMDYFVAITKALLDQKYNSFQTITNYYVEKDMTKIAKKDVVKHNRNMRELKNSK